jgi:hypothetical protein
VSYDQSRFRITPWPGIGLPRPLTLATRPYQLSEEGVLLPGGEESRTHVLDLSRRDDPVAEIGEIYLRLCRIDLANEDDIVGFCTRFGRTLGVRHGDFAAFRDFPDFDVRVRTDLEAAWPQTWDGVGLLLNEGIEDFRFGARCLRDLVRARQVLAGRDDGSPWESLADGSSWVDESQLGGDESRADRRANEAEAAIVTLANPALQSFQPRFFYGSPDESTPFSFFLGEVPLYALCCAEFYNHMSEEAPYATCANETCQGTFVRQAGRAIKGQYRSHGVRFCSYECANMQTQRVHRKKKAAARAAAGAGAKAKAEKKE